MKTLTNLFAAFWPPALLRATDPFPAWNELTPMTEPGNSQESARRIMANGLPAKRIAKPLLQNS